MLGSFTDAQLERCGEISGGVEVQEKRLGSAQDGELDEELLEDELELELVPLQLPAVTLAPATLSESIFGKPSAVDADNCRTLLPCTKSTSTDTVCQFAQPPVAGKLTE